MLSAESISLIESEGKRLTTAARRDPRRPVPQYPGWTLSDLASHIASVHGRTVLICRELPQSRISAPRLPVGRDPIDWCEEMLSEMIDALSEADPLEPSWAFGPKQILGFWGPRMLVETGLHRWDAEQAFEEPEPLDGRVAEAGLDEFWDMFANSLEGVQTIALTATDMRRTWTYGVGAVGTSVAGPASEIHLRLMSRPSSVELPEDWATAVDSLAPPPKR